jgi:hypothetical protein
MTNELQFLIYNTPQDDIKVDVVVKEETIWLTQKAMAELFGVQVPDISKHIKNIYETGELAKKATISKIETVVKRGFRGEVNEELDFYNLDMIISHKMAEDRAFTEYDEFNKTQKIISDFDKKVKELTNKDKIKNNKKAPQ